MRRSMKRLGLAAVGLGLVLGLVWVLSPDAPEQALPRARLPGPESTWSVQALTAPTGGHGTQTLGGRVLGPEGPVPGALVVALAPPDAGWRSLSAPAPRKGWSPCLQDPALVSVLEWVEAHRADALPLAHATTDAQGRFLLEGLGQGPFVLWAEKGSLVGLREGAGAGERDEDVTVSSGRRFSATVRGESKPLAGVHVTALVRAAGRVIDTLTDENGHFVLGPLPEGEHPLVLSKEGWLTRLVPRTEGMNDPTLSRTHRLAGRVLDERGPVANATVQLERTVDLAAVITDEQGRFELEGLCAGRSMLVARQAGRLARRWVDPGPERPVELFLSPAVRVSGRVIDTSGRAVEDAEVSAQGEGESAQRLQTRTDARGHFLLEPLVPGLYGLRAQAAHLAPVQRPRRLLVSSQEVEFELKPPTLLEGVVVDERGAPVDGVELRLKTGREPDPPAATSGAQGHFTLETPRPGTWRLGTSHPDFLPEDMKLSAPARDVRVVLRHSVSLEVEVVDAAGRPMELATVGLTGGTRARGTTGADGRLPLRNLPSGAYTVTACAADLGRVASVEASVMAPESRTVRLVLPAGTGHLSGRIVDGRGGPVENAVLWVSPAPPLPTVCPTPLRTSSGPDGSFSLPALSEGRWQLIASAEGFSWDIPASRGVESTENKRAAWVRIASGESRIQLVLRARPPAHEVRGQVVRETGEPVTGFQLNGRAVSHPEGRFSLPLEGPMRLDIEAPGLTPLIQRVSPTEGDDLGVRVLKALVPVEGRVVDALSSAPVSQAQVSVKRSPQVSWPGVAYSRPDGHFLLEEVPPTVSVLTVSHPLYPPMEVAVVVGQPVQVRLAPGASLSGRVESDDVPVEVGTVQLYSALGDIVASTELWHGRYSLELLAAGHYTARVLGPRGEGPAVLFPLRSVELTAGEQATLDFTGHVTGVSLDVLLPGQDIDVYLVPGELPLLSPKQGLYNKLKVGIMGKRVSDSARHFSQLPEGSYTLIAIRHDESGADVHREQVELPAEGELSFTLAPLWNRFED